MFTSLVIPRPIAWVSSLSKNGTLNLAPFSFFNAVGCPPPTVMVSIDTKRTGPKDTLIVNVRDTGEFTLSLVDTTMLEQMNLSSGEWPSEVDEYTLAHLTPIPSRDVKPPYVAEARAAIKGDKITQIVPVEGTESTLIIGRVVLFHLIPDILQEDGSVDPHIVQPLGRLGGDNYTFLGDVVALARPKVTNDTKK